LGLVSVLLLAIVLRAWGIRHGLPFIYNPDERGHFVPKAVHFFSGSYNPHYFVNPPAFSYFIYSIFAVWYHNGAKVVHAYLSNPSQVFLIGRLCAAALGVVSVWITYLAGERMFNRSVGLVAAAILAVAFLPVFYAHQALNDAPTLVPVTLSLLGIAGVLRKGRTRDYVLAGIGVGLGAATKYPAGFMALPLLAATVADIRRRAEWREPIAALALAGVATVASFVAANPYAILDHRTFLSQISLVSPEHTFTAAGKLGARQQSGVLYYMWALTWGLGWVPVGSAVVAGALLLKEDRRAAAVLVPAPILFILYVGSQSRYFARWIIPVLPLLALLAGYLMWRLSSLILPRIGRLAPVAAGLALVALLGQGLVTSIHGDLVLSNTETQALARGWIFAHIPAGTLIVVEPTYLLLERYGEDPGSPGEPNAHRRWRFLGVRRELVRAGLESREILAKRGAPEYQRILSPQLIDIYQREGACWVITGSYAWGRAFANPDEVPNAVAYYRELSRRGEVRYSISPYRAGHEPLSFNFDWSTNYYPLSFARPGPEITIYHLAGCT
jgi:hypothetical protein